MRPTAIDLFAGVGGMSLGFEQAGFDVLAAVEFDAIHAAAHHYNFPLTEMLCADARSLSGRDVIDAANRGRVKHRRHDESDAVIDVVFGGPSCQGFSTIGRRIVEDERNLLVGEFVRLVTEIAPRAFCLENVPGILNKRFVKTLENATRTLTSAGYHVAADPQILNALDFGVPQSRKRVFLIGTLDCDPPKILRSSRTSLTVADALEGLPDPCSYELLSTEGKVRLSPTDTARRKAAKGLYARNLSGVEHDPGDLSRLRNWHRLWITNSLVTNHGKQAVVRFAGTEPGHVEPVSHYYRLAWNKPSRTLRSGTGNDHGSHTSPRPIHPEQPRVITAREAARIQSFPDWFRFNITNWHGHRQIGNSVPPLLARAVAKQLAHHLGIKPGRSKIVIAPQDDKLLTSRGIKIVSS